jgi:glycoside/pentoside/hexuronide:cation symporter, GPH family
MSGARPRLSVGRNLGYGFGNVAYSTPYQATATFFLLFATAILRIPAGVAGIALAASALWDAAIDPVAGHLSDHTRSRQWGRRHGYLVAGGLGVAVSSALLWNVSPSASARAIFAFAFLMAVKTSLTFFNVPYLALGGELSNDYDERSSIQGYRAVFYLAGMILALAGGFFVFFRSSAAYPRGQLNPAAYPPMGIAIAAAAVLPSLAAFAATRVFIPTLPKAEERSESAARGSLFREFFGALSNPGLRAVATMIFVLEAGFQFGIVLGIHVNTYTYGLTGPVMGLLTFVLLGTSIASQPFWVWFTKRWEKRTALLFGLGLGVVGFAGAPWTHVWWKLFPLEPRTLPLTLGVFNVIAGIANGAFMSIPNAMVSDAADVEELATGRRVEGVYFGTYTLAYKLGTTVSLAVSGFALAAMGFDPSRPAQSEATKFHLAMVPTYLLLAAGLGALLAIWRYPITRARWLEVRRALDARRTKDSRTD